MSQWALVDWAGRTALPEILGVRLTKSTKDRLYHTSDDLLAHRKVIEAALTPMTRLRHFGGTQKAKIHY